MTLAQYTINVLGYEQEDIVIDCKASRVGGDLNNAQMKFDTALQKFLTDYQKTLSEGGIGKVTATHVTYDRKG